MYISDGLILFENLPYEAQNLDSSGPESLRQLDVEVAVGVLVAALLLIFCLRYIVEFQQTAGFGLYYNLSLKPVIWRSIQCIIIDM